MPIYKCRRVECGQVTGSSEVDSPDEAMAWDEAHDGLSVYKGQWAEIIEKATEPQQPDKSAGP